MANVGGQAVIEGVMMRSPKYIVTSVRKPSGEIVHKKEPVKTFTNKQVLKWPFIRGMIAMGETMVMGVKSLNYSANQALDEEEEETSDKLSSWTILGTLAISLGFTFVVFKLIPLGFAQFLNNRFELFQNRYLFNLSEGLLKLTILVGYIYAISKFKDVKRVFQYHGAEHKAVNCYEKEKEVTVALAKKHTTLHRRCGTTFILFVIMVSIGVYLFLPINTSFVNKYLLRLALLPLIAGISYEILKLSAKHENSTIFNMLASPGFMLQKLTTSEPDDEQLEVAVHALNESLKEEKELIS